MGKLRYVEKKWWVGDSSEWRVVVINRAGIIIGWLGVNAGWDRATCRGAVKVLRGLRGASC